MKTRDPMDGLDHWEQGAVRRLARIVDGKFSVSMEETIVQRESLMIARRLYDVMMREVRASELLFPSRPRKTPKKKTQP